MPPAPKGDWISYGPNFVPGGRDIRVRHYIPVKPCGKNGLCLRGTELLQNAPTKKQMSVHYGNSLVPSWLRFYSAHATAPTSGVCGGRVWRCRKGFRRGRC